MTWDAGRSRCSLARVGWAHPPIGTRGPRQVLVQPTSRQGHICMHGSRRTAHALAGVATRPNASRSVGAPPPLHPLNVDPLPIPSRFRRRIRLEIPSVSSLADSSSSHCSQVDQLNEETNWRKIKENILELSLHFSAPPVSRKDTGNERDHDHVPGPGFRRCASSGASPVGGSRFGLPACAHCSGRALLRLLGRRQAALPRPPQGDRVPCVGGHLRDRQVGLRPDACCSLLFLRECVFPTEWRAPAPPPPALSGTSGATGLAALKEKYPQLETAFYIGLW